MSENLNCKIHVLQGGGEVVTSGFGPRRDPITGAASSHNGLDLIGGDGSGVILCAADGTVQRLRNSYSGSTRDGSAGNYIIVQHDGYDTVYYHLKKDSLRVKAGQKVKAGQALAEMGCTGHATGVHLHFGIDIEKNSVGSVGWADPVPYLRGEKTMPGMPTCTSALPTVQGNRGDKPVIRWGTAKTSECKALMDWLNQTYKAGILADGNPGNRTYQFAQKLKVKRDVDGYPSKWVQGRLKTMGFYTGLVDGEPRGLTDAAIRAFQAAYGLTPDGVVEDTDWYYLLAWEV